MSELIKITSYLFYSFLFFGFLAMGISMLVTSRERLMERFSEFFFMLTNRSYTAARRESEKYIILTARASGIFSVAVAFLGAWIVWSKVG